MRRWRRALLAAAAAGAAGDGGGSSRLIQCGTLHVSRANVHTLPLSHPVICIWGSNTGVGKTLFSAALAAACARAQVGGARGRCGGLLHAHCPAPGHAC